MSEQELIRLDESTLIGKGGSKNVYMDPRDDKRCIKIIVVGNGQITRDLRIEKAYRRARKIRRLPPSKLMVAYYGEVQTNLGTGYVFERAADYDGSTSLTFEQLIDYEIQARQAGQTVRELLGTEKQYPLVIDALRIFRTELFQENIIIPDMGAFNYVVQFTSSTDWQVRIIDDIGCPTLIPVNNWIDYFGRKHVRRRWDKFIKEIISLWPGFLSEAEIVELMVRKKRK